MTNEEQHARIKSYEAETIAYCGRTPFERISQSERKWLADAPLHTKNAVLESALQEPPNVTTVAALGAFASQHISISMRETVRTKRHDTTRRDKLVRDIDNYRTFEDKTIAGLRNITY